MLEGSYGKLEPKHQDVLNKVYVSTERLINLVEDLLNISRIESGRMEYKFDKWDLPKLCSEIIDTFVLRAKERGFYLDYKAPENGFPEVTTDGTKLREVVSNLIDNALKYTQRGGVSVRLSHEGTVVKVIVTDTGIGIPKEELPYLFSKFSRGKDTNRLNTSGTGLGLYVGKSIIEALGGKIWAESEGAGKGSRFIIELPVERTEESQ
jgi:signal transduction histidine kinase